jgi:lipopolysaccharide biosynthesis glycosyltransferase
MNTNQSINIAYTSSTEYGKYIPIAVFSLLSNNQSSNFNIYILTNGISDHDQSRIGKVIEHFGNASIKYLIIDETRFAKLGIKQTAIHQYYGFYRFMLEELLPDAKKVLHLGLDTLILDDLDVFFKSDFEGKSIITADNLTLTHNFVIAYKNCGKNIDITDNELRYLKSQGVDDHEYFNDDVVFYNLKTMRQKDKGTKYLLKFSSELLGENTIVPFSTQTIQNIAFFGDDKKVSGSYNVGVNNVTTDLLAIKDNENPCSNMKIIQYFDPKPWGILRSFPVGKIYFHYYKECLSLLGDMPFIQPNRLALLRSGKAIEAITPRQLYPAMSKAFRQAMFIFKRHEGFYHNVKRVKINSSDWYRG